MATTVVEKLPQLQLGTALSLRFIHFHPEGTFSVKNVDQAAAQTLYLASDLLTGSDQNKKNHARIHAHFAKMGLATCVTFSGVHVENQSAGTKRWFYNVQGVFKLVFEYHNIHMQKLCLLFLRDVWLSSFMADPLPAQLTLTLDPGARKMYQNEGIQDLYQEQILKETTCDGSENFVGLDENNDTIEQTVTCERTQDITELTTQVRTSKPPVSSAVLKNTGGADKIRDLDNLMTYLNQMEQSIRMEAEKYSDELKQFFHHLENLILYLKLTNSNSTTETKGDHFPLQLLEHYIHLLQEKSCMRKFENQFGIPRTKHACLCLISEWLGKEFSQLAYCISEQVNAFKTRHIQSLNDLPSPQVLVQQLFPQCMELMLFNWMQTQTTEDQALAAKRPCLAHSRIYPFVQLILEFVNDALVSGTAHVLYSRLVQNARLN